MRIINRLSVLLCVPLCLTGCMKWDYSDSPEDFDAPGSGLFILNEGNFQYGNASLSYYDPATDNVENEVFLRANGMKLGDVAQSMTVYDDKGWIVVNNSHVVFAIDLSSFKEIGRIENLTSPRYIHFVSDDKAYVSQLWDNRIFIVDPRRYEVTGYIEVPDMAMGNGSTEQMVQIGKYVYCNCWSYQNRIIKIDTESDRVVASVTVGVQPTSLAVDRYGRLWTVTDGGYEDSPYGYEAPSLFRIDPEKFTIEKEFKFRLGNSPCELQTNGDGSLLYWVDDDIWCMDVDAERLPVRPFLERRDTKYYGLTVSPSTGDVYVADAIDYQQQGMIYRYTPEGELADEFYVGITPGAVCWK
ncbi:YncE family protein [uncultured Duncaniella sp.]|uniref:YncE family protein n=1 Tax=uncultured Duncaniella sp. TaxID=2768039 RepID=UPI002613E76D|nr:YncE family protein [uncultured Duncaniella sp.]